MKIPLVKHWDKYLLQLLGIPCFKVIFKYMHIRQLREAAPRDNWWRLQGRVQRPDRRPEWKLPGFSPPHFPPDPKVTGRRGMSLDTCFGPAIMAVFVRKPEKNSSGFISSGNGCHTCLMTMRKGRVWWGRQHLKAGEHLWGFDCLGLSCTSDTAEWSQFCKNNVPSVRRQKD